MIQASADGILTMLATGNDRPKLFEIFVANDPLDFSVSIFTRDHNDLANTGCTLKCGDCMGDNRSAGDRRKQFIETHAATVTGVDDDGCSHDQKKKLPTP